MPAVGLFDDDLASFRERSGAHEDESRQNEGGGGLLGLYLLGVLDLLCSSEANPEECCWDSTAAIQTRFSRRQKKDSDVEMTPSTRLDWSATPSSSGGRPLCSGNPARKWTEPCFWWRYRWDRAHPRLQYISAAAGTRKRGTGMTTSRFLPPDTTTRG